MIRLFGSPQCIGCQEPYDYTELPKDVLSFVEKTGERFNSEPTRIGDWVIEDIWANFHSDGQILGFILLNCPSCKVEKGREKQWVQKGY